jgi:cellulose 1,4-beta-cellobiosidase
MVRVDRIGSVEFEAWLTTEPLGAGGDLATDMSTAIDDVGVGAGTLEPEARGGQRSPRSNAGSRARYRGRCLASAPRERPERPARPLTRVTRQWGGPCLAMAFAASCAGLASSPGGLNAAGVKEASAPAEGNPFPGAILYSNPEYAARVESTAATLGSSPLAEQARKVAHIPTAIWLSSISEVGRAGHWLDGALALQKSVGRPVVSVLVVHDLPNRDCAGRAAAGELTVQAGGEQTYRTRVIDPLARELKARPQQRIVVLLEPDSLPNLVTNLDDRRCADSAAVYKRSLAYAIAALFAPNVSVYLDVGHAGWLGWRGTRGSIAELYKGVLADAGGDQKIRGFFTNVSNFNVLQGRENLKLEPSNPCPDEWTYVQELAESMRLAGIKHKGYIIDTGRGGRDGIRTQWGNWCNVKGAGLGPLPRAAPAPLLDAFLWVRPPGESDGTSNPRAPHFDRACASPDAAPGAPEAGQWFPSYFVELVKNANPPF